MIPDSSLPNPVELAVPAFILLVLLEIGLAWWWGRAAYELRDTAASLLMGLGNLVIGLVIGVAILAVNGALYSYRLFEIGYAGWAFVDLNLAAVNRRWVEIPARRLLRGDVSRTAAQTSPLAPVHP